MTPRTCPRCKGHGEVFGQTIAEAGEQRERTAAIGFLRQWAENMRKAESEAERDENGKASLFSDVGLAEAQLLDLEAAALVLEAAADALERGAHDPPPGPEGEA